MKYFFNLVLLVATQQIIIGQINESPCSHEAIMERQLALNPNAERELMETEATLQELITQLKASDLSGQRNTSSYVIPVVMHVFHFGDEGRMGMEQALAGLEIMNADFNGLNDGWDTIDSEFDSIKGELEITFCLATIDPDGNPTTGLIYHENEEAMYNQGNLFEYAWDNYKYLNIYFPKYTGGAPSNFTAYAYYPSISNTENNTDGIFYSSIRWGYGDHSELEEGDDWASVCSHEAGHWLNLRHTFEGECSTTNDFVDDTPPTLGGSIELEGCYNHDFSCGVRTNGENFMDYNHRCKKMFTQGQVERMEAALYLSSRINLWSEENLIETGCLDFYTTTQDASSKEELITYPNPTTDYITFKVNEARYELMVYNTKGQLHKRYFMENAEGQIDVSSYGNGLYFFSIVTAGKVRTGKFMVHR